MIESIGIYDILQFKYLTHNTMLQLIIIYYLILQVLGNTVKHSTSPNINIINNRIKQINENKNLPIYSLTKISYTNLTKTSTQQLKQCIYQPHQQRIQYNRYNQHYQLFPAVNIHQMDAIGWPALVRVCHEYYTVNGYKIGSFVSKDTKQAKNKHYSHFINSVRNQYTYFAQIQWSNASNISSVLIKKLQTRNKKITLQQQVNIQIPMKYGQITSFAISFSISLKMFAFITNLGHLLFYKQDGKLEYHLNLFNLQSNDYLTQNRLPMHLSLVKLNNHLAIFTTYVHEKYQQQSFLYTINTNGKNTTLRKYKLPIIQFPTSQKATKYQELSQQQNKIKMQLKYNDNNWNQFYIKINDRIYVYEQSNAVDKSKQVQPRIWYPLIDPKDRFYIAGIMIIVQSDIKSQNQNEVFRFYYNITSGSSNQLAIPYLPCPNRTYLSSSSHSQNSHILCLFCHLSYQCYSIYSNSLSSSANKSDYADYSKLRVPLIVVSIGIIIYVSVTRGKKSKSLNQEKQEEDFMKELEKRDKKLFEELKRTRKNEQKDFGIKQRINQRRQFHQN